MSEVTKIFLTSAITVCGSVLVLVLGQWVLKFILEPIQEQSRLIGEIASSLIFYANISPTMTNRMLANLDPTESGNDIQQEIILERRKEIIRKGEERADEAQEDCRKQASELLGATYAIRGYWLWSRLGFVPKLDDVIAAHNELIGYSNSFHTEHSGRSKRIKKIAKLLKITTLARKYGVD